MSTMPKQKPGRSKQDYGTPKSFLGAVKVKLSIDDFDIDLAASADNTICPNFYDEVNDSQIQPWRVGNGWNWLNPPFAQIGPWVQKAFTEANFYHAKTAVLVPASVGSNWWTNWVHNRAYVLMLKGRLTFVGEITPYPKDCALLLYNYTTIDNGGYSVWNWAVDVNVV